MRTSTIAAFTFANIVAAAPTTTSSSSVFIQSASFGGSILLPAMGGRTSSRSAVIPTTSPSSPILIPAIGGRTSSKSVIIPTTSPSGLALIPAMGGRTSSRSAIIPTTSSTSSVVVPITSSIITSVVPTASAAVETPLATSATFTTSFVTPVAAQATTPLATPSDYPSTALYGHNIHRANHSAPALTYNDQLAGYAATVAASCNFAHDLSEGGGGYGQNIAAYGSSDLTGFTDEIMLEVAISDQWYDGEVNYFLPEYYGEATPDMDNFEDWGHFSQIVWFSSTGVGCATQLCSPGTIFDDIESFFTVCNYEGAGNVGGLYGVNVLRPLGDPTYAP